MRNDPDRMVGAPPFIDGNRVRGRVVAVETTAGFPDQGGKVGAWVSGHAWEFGQHQWHESSIYVSPVDDMAGDIQRCLHFRGDLRGAVHEGNVVDATVRVRSGSIEVVSLFNETTQEEVVTAGSSMVGLALLALLAALLIWFVASGALAAVAYGVRGLLIDLMGCLVFAAIALSFLPRGKR